MKKILLLLLALSVLLSGSGVLAKDMCTIYNMDGWYITVPSGEVDEYLQNGWYEKYEDVTCVMYSMQGGEITVYKNEAPVYEKLGWFRDKSDVTCTVYAADGREILIYKSQLQSYKNVGWYENREDVLAVMCAPDGRKITIYKAEIPAFKAVGWSLMQSDKIDPSKPMIALTFDDGPRRASTERILNVLERHNARATFFVLGNRINTNDDLLRRMNSVGCQIGNHSYSHPSLTDIGTYGVKQQISLTAEMVKNATGKYPTAVRPPYGNYNGSVLYACAQPVILWSVDTLDWQSRNASAVVNHILTHTKDGDIILMHDIYDSTAEAAERVIPILIEKGFQLVTVDELAWFKNYTVCPSVAYRSFR